MENRLTDRTESGIVYLINEPAEDIYGNYTIEGYKMIQTVIERLFSYENAESEGRLIELPCKVGTGVWEVSDEACDCNKCLYYREDESCLKQPICKNCKVVQRMVRFGDIDRIGKTVFLTHADALAALKGESHEND